MPRRPEVPTPVPQPVPKSQPPPPSKAPLPRPALDEKLVALPVNVAASLKAALEKLKNAAPSADSEASGDQGNGARSKNFWRLQPLRGVNQMA
ncbi:unnamed protein product [Schistocephalus solidus]|uniref:WH2 domain-containing protein n=1 Tax=Schistocephalus solidus TaxID=70667 RepID=A0A183TAT3_SCHSO|nr:unnamed protein product [Schistocephalus solidus]